MGFFSIFKSDGGFTNGNITRMGSNMAHYTSMDSDGDFDSGLIMKTGPHSAMHLGSDGSSSQFFGFGSGLGGSLFDDEW